MAKKAHPWFWGARNGWYLMLRGQRHFPGEHPDAAPKPEKSKKTGQWNSPPEIDGAFRRLLDGGTSRPSSAGGDTVVQVLDDFVAWCHKNWAALTTGRYEDFIQDFVTASEEGGLKFGALPPSVRTSRHVTCWLGQRPTWGPRTKRNAITALIRGFNRAVKNRGQPCNSVDGMEKPKSNRPNELVTLEELEILLSHVAAAFRDLLVISYDCRAGHQEVKNSDPATSNWNGNGPS